MYVIEFFRENADWHGYHLDSSLNHLLGYYNWNSSVLPEGFDIEMWNIVMMDFIDKQKKICAFTGAYSN